MLAPNPDALSVLTTVLNLTDVTVTNIRHSLNGHSVILVISSTQKHVTCSRCGKLTCGHGSGRTLRLRHLPLLDREKAMVKAFFQSIPKRLFKTIRAACCDLHGGYINTCKEAFGKKVAVVADRFYVRKLYMKSLVSIRKTELKRLKRSLDDEDYQKLKPAIVILRKQKDYFTDDEKRILTTLFQLSPKLKLAYQLSHQLMTIFNSHVSASEVKTLLSQWMEEVIASELKCFDRFIQMLSKHIDSISHYFIMRASSGFVEGFNNRVKVLKRRCYGLSGIKRLYQRIKLDTEGFGLFAPQCLLAS